MRTAGPGTRNSTLNLVAFRLGQLVATRALERTAVEMALTGAALAAGLGEREVERTIRSGLEAGLSHPRAPGWVAECEGKQRLMERGPLPRTDYLEPRPAPMAWFAHAEPRTGRKTKRTGTR